MAFYFRIGYMIDPKKENAMKRICPLVALNSYVKRHSSMMIILMMILSTGNSLQASVLSSQKSSPIIYVDCNEGLTSSYIAYEITNTSGANYPDFWVQLQPNGPAVLNEDGIYHVGPLANGASTVVYFYVDVPVCDDYPNMATPGPFNMTV